MRPGALEVLVPQALASADYNSFTLSSSQVTTTASSRAGSGRLPRRFTQVHSSNSLASLSSIYYRLNAEVRRAYLGEQQVVTRHG